MAFEAIMGIVMFYLNPKPHLLHRRSVDLLQPPSEKSFVFFTHQRQVCPLPSLMRTSQPSSLLMNYTLCYLISTICIRLQCCLLLTLHVPGDHAFSCNMRKSKEYHNTHYTSALWARYSHFLLLRICHGRREKFVIEHQ